MTDRARLKRHAEFSRKTLRLYRSYRDGELSREDYLAKVKDIGLNLRDARAMAALADTFNALRKE